ncbi:MAG: nucleoside kinase [Muribaculaceae bacterium]|nr:nucleoside kinase [Muribaculaceae bacterium]
MDKKVQIYCRNTSSYIDIDGGTSLMQIADGLNLGLNYDPICALVNNKPEHLGFNVYTPKQVEFVDLTSSEGKTTYTRTLCMLLYRALNYIDPSLSIRYEHSISHGIFCRIFDKAGNIISISDSLVEQIKQNISDLIAKDLPLLRYEKLTADVIEIFRRQRLDDKVKLLESVSTLYTSYYTLDGLADSFYGPLAPSTRYIQAFDLVAWHDGLLLLGADSLNPSLPAQPEKQAKMYDAFTQYLKFNSIIGVSYVGELNNAIANRRAADLINVAEALHNKRLGRISDQIMEQGASLIFIAGPSSSGKTTTAKRLAIQLMTNLMVPKLISLDDYFVNRKNTPLDENGDYDYESIYALDLDLFHSDMQKLLRGEEINLPTYSFELGERVEKERPLRLNKNDVLIIEGIHGLNPILSEGLPADRIFKMYVSALTTLHIDNHNWISTSDNRLLRRIVRDNKYRHTSPQDTIRRWPSVRRGEERWIFPFQENADATFNSSLLFELGVMKRYALPLLENVPHNIPEYATAYRLRRLLNCFCDIPEAQVPSTSLLREFLGGSSFHY